MVETKSEAVPGQSFTGRVWFISPVLNEETRTTKVLLNLNNTEHKLKPGMFVSAVIRAELLADGKPAPTGFEGQWSCQMHPLVLQPQAGQCPVCKMSLVQIPGTPASAKPEGEQTSPRCAGDRRARQRRAQARVCREIKGPVHPGRDCNRPARRRFLSCVERIE